jgi:L-rhamnose mutarotase
MSQVKRYGMVIGVKEGKIEEYKKLQADMGPDGLKMIREWNIHNYSIYLGELEDGRFYLFSYFEYTGDDFDSDLKKMAADPTTQKWWDVCTPCQQPIEFRGKEEWWMNMEEIFHCE